MKRTAAEMQQQNGAPFGHTHSKTVIEPGVETSRNCKSCSSAATKFRWPDRRGRVYCIDCWKSYGSVAADVFRTCLEDPSLRRSEDAIPICFKDAPSLLGTQTVGPPLQLEVTPEDSFEAALRLLASREEGDLKRPPIVLNMANSEWIGGGFLTGASGQEEELCRRSNLFVQLLEAENRGDYPLEERGCIVTPEVRIFSGRDYKRLPQASTVAVITAAALFRPDVSSTSARRAYVDQMGAKIEALLAVIQHMGYTDVVLSAWGCGAFRNPPKEVAALFRDALTGPFRTSFNHVVFSIFDRADWQESNYTVFRDILLA